MIYANNGMLIPYQPKGTDTVPAMLTPGEFVINRAATQKNLPLLKSINSGSNDIQQFAVGGLVSSLKRKNVNRMENKAQDADRRNSWIGLNADGKPMDKLGIPIDNLMDIYSSDVMLVNAQSKDKALEEIKKNTNFDNTVDTVERASILLRKQKLNLDENNDPKSDSDLVLDELVYQIALQPKRFEQDSYTDPSKISVVDKAKEIMDKMNGAGGAIPPGVVPNANLPLPNGQQVNAQQLADMTQLVRVKQESDRIWSRVNYLTQVKQNTKAAMEILKDDMANNQKRNIFDGMTIEGQEKFDPTGERNAGSNIGINKNNPNMKGTQVLTAQNSWATDELDYIKAVYDEIMVSSTPQQRANLAQIPRPQPVLSDETTAIPAKFNRGGIVYAEEGMPVPKVQMSQMSTNNKDIPEEQFATKQEGKFTKYTITPEEKSRIIAISGIPPEERKPEQNQFLIDIKAKKQRAFLKGAPECLKKVLAGQSLAPAEQSELKDLNTTPQRFNRGGVVYASEGTLVNYQPRGTDTVPAMLTPGEFVVNAKSAQKNLSLLHSINSNNYANGGRVSYLAGGTKKTMEEERLANIKERRESIARDAEAKKQALRDGRKDEMQSRRDSRKTEMQSRRDAVTTSKTQGISYQQARQQQIRPAPEPSGGVTTKAGIPPQQPQQQVIPQQPQQRELPPQTTQISPQTQQRVGMAAQAAFNPQNAGDSSKQLVIFGTLLTGVNQVVTQFGAVMQQLVASASLAGGGVINKGEGQPSTDGISQFTTSLNNFVNQLQKLNIPPEIKISISQTKPIDVNINGADALQALLAGPLGAMITQTIGAVFNKKDVDNEKLPGS
jgi:hypothetical protein